MRVFSKRNVNVFRERESDFRRFAFNPFIHLGKLYSSFHRMFYSYMVNARAMFNKLRALNGRERERKYIAY